MRDSVTLTKSDPALYAALEQAREAAIAIAEPGTVGEHLGMAMEGERVATHRFRCEAAGYRGWAWSVSVARVPRSRKVTVCETHLLPDEGALLSPAWVPYAQRLAPGDLGAGDVLPYTLDDPNLEAGFEVTGEDESDQLAVWELGLGRARVLSPVGRSEAAQRWYDGAHGPSAASATQSEQACGSCGYFLPLAGALRALFGVCASEWSSADGAVVSLDHGCGAHSETDIARPQPHPMPVPLVDDLAVDVTP